MSMNECSGAVELTTPTAIICSEGRFDSPVDARLDFELRRGEVIEQANQKLRAASDNPAHHIPGVE